MRYTYSRIHSFLCVGIVITGCFYQQANAIPDNRETTCSQKCWENNQQKPVLFEDALATLHEKKGINIVADAYPGEITPLPMSAWENLSADEAVHKIAESCDREIIELDGIMVLRARQWARRQQLLSEKSLPSAARWQDGGKFIVNRLDSPEDKDYPQPARSISVIAYRTSTSQLCSQLREKAAYQIVTDSKVAERRVHVFAERITPSNLIGCIAVAINAGPEVKLTQSENQANAENYAALAVFPDKISKRMRESDKLRRDLEPLLTKEQKKSLEDGQSISIRISDLPTGLQKRAMDYISASAQWNAGSVETPDMTRMSQFGIRFRPSSSGVFYRMLGVITVDVNGTEYYY